MATFGESLRRERELRGITLPELANATKIGLRYLGALESDEFQKLPGGVFNRGFVRAVARYMNLDEHHWVGEYARAAHEEPEILARYAPPQARSPASTHRGWWSFALLVILFGAGAYVIHQERQRAAAEASLPEASLPAVLPPASDPAPPLEPARSVEPPAEQSASQAALPAPSISQSFIAAEELLLQVDVPVEDAWVSVTVDGQLRYEGLMEAGESRSFRGNRRIELITGNASAVILTLNGETLPLLGEPRERKKLILTANDLNPSP